MDSKAAKCVYRFQKQHQAASPHLLQLASHLSLVLLQLLHQRSHGLYLVAQVLIVSLQTDRKQTHKA
jgi:hypothetical protein